MSANSAAPTWTFGRKVRGQRNRSAPCGRGALFQNGDGPYFASFPRGAGDREAFDPWGPLSAKTDEAALAEGLAWSRRLERAGWFKMKADGNGRWNPEQMAACLSKLPRSAVIPDYLLRSRDRAEAEAGRARRGNRVQVGGIDIHALIRSGGIGVSDFTRMDIAITRPSESPDSRQVRLSRVRDLDVSELDAVIELLLDARARMTSRGTANAVDSSVFADLPDAAAEPDAVRERYELIRSRTQAARNVMDALMTLDQSRMAMAGLLMGALAVGDEIAGVRIVRAGSGDPDVGQFQVDPKSMTGEMTMGGLGADVAIIAPSTDALH